jgi:iron complex outermembrane receptor protein
MANRYFRGSLMTTTVIAGFAFAAPAFAQDVPAPVQDEAVQTAPTDQTPATQENVADTPTATTEDSGQEVIVTGSRIVSPNIVSLAPVQVVGETEIDQSGALNIQEVLLENPAFGTPGLSRTNSAFLTSGAGVATVDLRDLGSDRTLVLINSRRVVAGLPGSATVDLNVIPTQFVERVDILTGGASSLYGSDAVAGVVNFLYKRNFSGLLVEGQYGVTHRGDSGRYQLSVTGGGNFADDRGNLMVHLGYTNEKGLLSRERKNTRVDDITEFTYSYDPDDFGVERIPFFSSFVPQGRFNAGGTNFSFDPITNELFPCFSTNFTPTCTGVNGGTATGPFGFNRQFFRTLAVPVERYLFATRGTFEIADNIGAFMEGTYAKTTSSREIEPFALDSNNIFTVNGPSNARMPIETRVGAQTIVNPFVPTQIVAAATDTDGDGLRDISFARRLTELGTRNSSSTRDYFRFVVGLEGKVLDDRFSWDISYNYGQTSEQQTSNGQPNTVSFRNALAAITENAGTGDLNGNGVIGDVVCASAQARDEGCVPINIFGRNAITPEAAAYVRAEQTFQTRITQQVWAANLSGSLVELPAGPLGVAVGAEYRKETSRENNDALTNAGLNAGNALPDTEGEFDVKEAYAEVNIPVLKDQPFFHSFNIRAAGRLSDYSTVGGVETYNVGADWEPIEAVRFRATYAKSVRAPNIGELFTGPSQTFPTGLVDPCTGVTLTSTGAVAANCLADPTVLANIAANAGTFTLTQADKQGISGFNSGNPDLDAERSRSITAGVVINPRQIDFLRNFVLSVDYYNIRIKDAIIAPPRAFTLQQCYEFNDPFFCGLIQRRIAPSGSNSVGSLEFIDAPALNGGKLKVEGIDFVATYRTGLDSLWTGLNLNARLAWTHVLDGHIIVLPGADKDPFAGEVGTAKDRVNGTLAFSTDKVGLSFTGTYIGKSFEDDQYLAQFGLDDDAISVPGQFYLDAQATFTPARQYELFVGVDNLLDNKAPNLLSGTTFNTTGADTAADVYDIFGRRYYAGVRLRF